MYIPAMNVVIPASTSVLKSVLFAFRSKVLSNMVVLLDDFTNQVPKKISGLFQALKCKYHKKINCKTDFWAPENCPECLF
jgi:hypothetical protein